MIIFKLLFYLLSTSIDNYNAMTDVELEGCAVVSLNSYVSI